MLISLLPEHGPDTYLQRLALLGAACVLAAAWLQYCSSRRLQPGPARLATALPVVVLCLAAPLLFEGAPSAQHSTAGAYSEIVTVVLVEFALTWLCAFKVLAWAFDRGPLARPWDPLQFAAVMLAPITPVSAAGVGPASKQQQQQQQQQQQMPQQAQPRAGAGRQGEHAGGAGALALAFGVKAGLVLAGLAALRWDPPLLAREFLYTLGLYAILSFVMDGPAALASGLIGVRVSPHFDAPYLSASLAEFWSKRWDLAASNALRIAVYDPIYEGRLIPRPAQAAKHDLNEQQGASATAQQQQQRQQQRRRRRALAHSACFLVSGGMHELQFIYMTGHSSRGLMLAFFLAQVPLLAVERRMAAAVRRVGLRVPLLLRISFTLGTLLLLSHWTFWHACHKWGVTQSSLRSVSGSTEAVQGAALAAWSRLNRT